MNNENKIVVVRELVRIARSLIADATPESIAKDIVKEVKKNTTKSKVKTMHVYDMDDTLITSTASIGVGHKDGKEDTLDSVEFAHYKPEEGEQLDFGAFNDVIKPRKIKKNFDRLKEQIKDPNNRMVILTARPKGSESSIKKYLASEGITNIDVVALQSSNPQDKADWVDNEMQKHGYENVSFTDDSEKNAKAVAKVQTKYPKAKMTVENPPHPKEEDYDGDWSKESFSSDAPTKAKITFHDKPEVAEQKKKERKDKNMEWWDAQSPEFKKRYIKNHPDTQYKMGSKRMGSMNRYMQQIAKRQKDINNPKVNKYMKGFFDKFEAVGDGAGFWLDQLESNWNRFEKSAKGETQGFEKKDFDDLKTVIYG